MGPKYEFTDETMNFEGHLLHRIKRLSDGKLGGWLEKEDNLSQEGNCWVDGNAKVYDDAYVCGNAIIYTNAQVYGRARVSENATVSGEAWIFGNARVYDIAKVFNNAYVYGNAKVYDNAWVYDNAQIYNDAKIFGRAKVYGTAKVFDSAIVYSNAKIYGNAQVYGRARVSENATVSGEAWIFGNAWIYGNAEISGNAIICEDKEIYSGKYGEYYKDDSLNEDTTEEVIQDFIYKVDDSNKLTTQTEYDSVDEFFSSTITNDIKLDTLIICIIDTKEPLIKLQKVKTDNKIEFKFIVDITNKDDDDFIFRSIIKSQEQLNQLIQQTIDMLKQSPKFVKYVDDLENCL